MMFLAIKTEDGAMKGKSARFIAVCGVCEPGPISSRPSLAAFIHAYRVFSGMPNSVANRV